MVAGEKEDRKFCCSLAHLFTPEFVRVQSENGTLLAIAKGGNLKLVGAKTKAGLTGRKGKGESWEHGQVDPSKRQSHSLTYDAF